MRWTLKAISRWLPAALLLISMPQIALGGDSGQPPPSDEQSVVSVADCVTTCEEALESLEAEMQAELAACREQTVTLTECESACTTELRALRTELTADCDASVVEAIAAERRHYEPLVAGLQAERDEWETEAARQARAMRLWRGAAVVTGVAAAVAVGLVLFGSL